MIQDYAERTVPGETHQQKHPGVTGLFFSLLLWPPEGTGWSHGGERNISENPKQCVSSPRHSMGDTQTRPESRVQAMGPAPAPTQSCTDHQVDGSFLSLNRQRRLRECLMFLRTSMGKLFSISNPFPLLRLMSISFCREDTEYY